MTSADGSYKVDSEPVNAVSVFHTCVSCGVTVVSAVPPFWLPPQANRASAPAAIRNELFIILRVLFVNLLSSHRCVSNYRTVTILSAALQPGFPWPPGIWQRYGAQLYILSPSIFP